MRPMQHIAILGAGALGAFFAQKFFTWNPASVSFIAQGERAQRLKTEGLLIQGVPYLIPVAEPDASPPADLIIVAVKYHDLPHAISALQPYIGPTTLLLSVMNGLDSEERLAAEYGAEKVLYAIIVGIDAVRDGNRVTYSKEGKLFFGDAANTVLSERVQRVQALFTQAGIAFETPVDMRRMLWWKFMVNVGINQASAVLRAPYGVFHTSPEARAIMEAAMREVVALAQAAQVNLGEPDLAAWDAFLATLSPQGKTSMLQDIEARRKTEVEMLAGKVIELGAQYGIPTPVNLMLFRLIHVLEQTMPPA